MGRTFSWVWLAAVLTTGCTVGPDYVKPTIDTPDAWQEAVSEEVARGADASLQTWWTVLDDPVLDGLIERARQSNLDVRMAYSRVLETRARLGIARGERLPNVDALANAGRGKLGDDGALQQVAPPGGFKPQDLYTVGLDAIWEIDVFGRVRRSVEAADAQYDASIEDYRDVMVTLLAEVAIAYVDVCAFQQRLYYAGQNVDNQRNSLALAQDRANAGLSSDLDVAQARSNLRNTQAAVPPLEIGKTRALNRLAVLLGQDAGSLDAELAENRPIPVPGKSIGIGVPADVMRQRPDIRRAERELAAQTALIGVATADLYPRFGLTGVIGLASRSLGDLFNDSSVVWSAGLPVQWNLYSGGRVQGNIDVQKELTQQTLLRYQRSVLTALEEVENAIVAFNQGTIRRDRLQDAVKATDAATKLVTVQYNTGLTDFNNVLTTQRALFQQEDDLVNSEAQVVLDLIALYKALGGGWDIHAESPPVPTGE